MDSCVRYPNVVNEVLKCKQIEESKENRIKVDRHGGLDNTNRTEHDTYT